MLNLQVEFLKLLFALIALVSLIFLLSGLYKPWIVLWWEDVQTRKKVIKVYGTILVITLLVFWVLEILKIIT
jgi:hypothetical protein